MVKYRTASKQIHYALRITIPNVNCPYKLILEYINEISYYEVHVARRICPRHTTHNSKSLRYYYTAFN